MTKRIVLIIAMFLFPLLPTLAQNSDEVILKNGSVIRGSVIEIIPNGTVSIDDAAGNTWVFNMNEIDRIIQIEETKSLMTDQYATSWVNMTSIGFLAGANNSSQIAPFSLLSSFGYKNSMGFYTGLATGLEFLNINHVPVLFDLQYFLDEGEVVTTIILKGGYALPTKGESDYYGNLTSYKGGITGSVGLGLKIRTKENFAWDISVLYRYMQINYSEYNEWSAQDYQLTDIYNRLELRLGFYLN